MFGFFTKVVPNGVAMMPDISQYLDFVITIFFAFGVAFQVPVATFLLILSGVTTPEALAKKRPYIVIAAFVIGMILTPPDVFSQSLLAIPMWLLFELGLLMSRLFIKPKSVIAESNEYEIVEEEHQDLSDDDMDTLLDDMEAEEEQNRQEPPEKP
jgi:sec-independent protein translocase protein TatC